MLTMLDVAIGISFTYLLLSLLCSAINEWWATFWQMRGKVLARALSRLVEPNKDESREHADKILSQPEVRALSPSIDRPPSYLPKAVFVRAALKAGLALPSSRPLAAAKAPKPAGARVAPAAESTAAPGAASEAAPPSGPSNDEALEALETEWGELFDATMDRATGWYKRQLQTISMCVAIGLTIFANADTIRIADRLWRSPELRQQFVEAARRRVEQGEPKTVRTYYSDPNNSVDAVTSSDGEDPDESDGVEPQSPPISDSERELLGGVMGWREDYVRVNAGVCRRYEAARDELCDRPGGEASCDSLQAVIDADPRVRADGVHLVPTDAWPRWGWRSVEARDVLLLHLFGWLLTIAAISVGAPFWFDTLSRFVNIRGSGKPPKSADPKPSATATATAVAAGQS
jgi:hypothetical protein